jgi:GT2 family glycosyltransferase
MSLTRTPRISVVVISRNEGEWLRRTVEELIQTLPGASQIVVVDDASNDGSADFLRARRQGLRLLQTSGLGVARARNLGARNSSGDVIVFADAHLELQAGWWPPLVDVLRRPNAGAAAPAVADMENRKAFGYGFTLGAADLAPVWLKRLDRAPFHAPILPGCCLAMTREVFDRTGGFDRGLKSRGGIDAETGVRFWLQGYENWVTPESKVWHLFRSSAPFPVKRAEVIHNRLRLAFLHFSRQRVRKVRQALGEDPAFETALQLITKNDPAGRRRKLLATRVHDDRWFFRKFGITW